MMNRMVKGAVVLVAMMAGAATPAWADMPQTDTALVEQLSAKSSDEKLHALTLYYDLHVSEIEVQLMREQNTGAFLAARRAEGDGDVEEAKRQTEMFENTKDGLSVARQTNQDLRQELASQTGLAFGDDLVVAPDAPDALPAAPANAPAELLDARAAAWAGVEKARKDLFDVRLQLLEDQERYDKTRDVNIGNSMRAMTGAEVAMARAACDWRLVEAKIAAAAGLPLGDVLGGL